MADSWLARNVEDIIEKLGFAQVYSRLDMFTRYWQILLDEHVAQKTTFSCRKRTYMFTVMRFELMNAPTCFHRLGKKLCGDLPFFCAYRDDIIVKSNNLGEHIGHSRIVVVRIRKANMRIK